MIYPDPVPRTPPTDYGLGRRCAECGCKVNRYTAPQPKTGDDLCNLHWKLPTGYTYSARGVVKLRKDLIGA